MHPRGGGARRGGGMEHPPPLSHASLVERYSWKHPRPAASLMRLWLNGFRWNTPTARPLTRPPPAPSIGGGQCVAIAPDTVHGEQVMDLGEGVHIEPQICSS
jgi:hypothetical protein